LILRLKLLLQSSQAQITRHWSIPAEGIEAEGKTLCSEIHKLSNPIINKGELPQQGKESIIVTIYKKAITMTVVITEEKQVYVDVPSPDCRAKS
jgi:hypothetical protein